MRLRKLRYTGQTTMNEQLWALLCGTIFLTAGVAILKNLDVLANFDQRSGAKLHAWFKTRLGNSVLNREIYAVGTPGGLRKSTIGLRVGGVICVAVGLVLVIGSLVSLLR